MTGLAPLKRVADIRVSNVDKKSVEGQLPVRLCNYTDVYYRDQIEPDQDFMAATATLEQVHQFRLRLGDVLITKDSETADDIAVPTFVVGEAPDLVCGYHLAVLRPRPSAIYPRFLYWSIVGDRAKEQFSVAATGVTRFGLRQDEMGRVAIDLPSLGAQRAIADYLDTETARIDTLIAKKGQMLGVVREHLRVLVSQIIWDGSPTVIPLMHRTQDDRPIMYGIVLPGPSVESGVPIVKGGDVAARRLRLADLNRTTPEIEAPYARARLAAGDLVFAIRGGIGDVEIVPQELAGANITQDVARVAPAPGVDPEWLRLALGTFSVQADVDKRVTGATIRGINIGELKHVGVPASGADRQAADLSVLVPAIKRHDRMTEALTRQMRLLVEHRQALITAAVTGELVVPGMAA